MIEKEEKMNNKKKMMMMMIYISITILQPFEISLAICLVEWC